MACVLVSPHISSLACKPAQKTGRWTYPKVDSPFNFGCLQRVNLRLSVVVWEQYSFIVSQRRLLGKHFNKVYE